MAQTKKKDTAPAPRKGAPTAQERTPEPKASAKNGGDSQFWSVILFALGVLTALMVLIPGTAGWHAVHRFFLGMFGVAAFFVPMILIYTSVQVGMEKSADKVTGKVIWGIALMLLTSAAIQIFGVGALPGKGFRTQIKGLFKTGAELKGGGVSSMVIAGPLLSIFGGLGSKIITVLMFFVFAMLLSGKGLMEFLGLLAKPFKAVGRFFEGLYNMLVSGEFEDEYTDDVDDEKEKKRFAKDLEAINIVNGKNKPQQDSIEVPIHDNSYAAAPAVQEKNELGLFIDIPLPTDDLIPAEKPAAGKKPVAVKPKKVKQESGEDSLESLISRAAEHKDAPVQDIIDPVPEKEGNDDREIKGEQLPIYILPTLDLLEMPQVRSNSAEAAAEMREKADVIQNTMRSFGVEVKIRNIYRGPAITRYELQPGAGVKVSKIRGLEDDIALSLAAQGVRIEAPIPGKAAVGIEVPNTHKDMVTLREILSSQEFRDAGSKLTFAVGKDITGNIILGDIAKMPHVIIAGTTGSGKSVCTRSIIMSILYNAKPTEVRLILIDPKIVEFKAFDGLPHLLIPIVTEAKRAAGALNWAVNEMMRRYNTFADFGANDLKSYNDIAEQQGMEQLPQIVIFIDELADMMLVAGKEVEDFICRLAQMGRAAGMHLVVATQRPTTDVITGLIKANIPSRIALSVKSQIDSRTIIDMGGADKLLGNGDMLYMPIGMIKPVRVQGCFASNKDISTTLDFIRAQMPDKEPMYDPNAIKDIENYEPSGKGDKDSGGGDPSFEAGSDEDYFERAMEVAVHAGQLSTSMLQRKLKLGYARAARIMDELEERGVIGPSEGAKPRRVLMSKMQFDERKMRMLSDQD